MMICPFTSGDPIASKKDFTKRWDLAKDADQLCPTPHMMASDITHSAREAWRNSSRCIGRRHWNSLRVIDARSSESPEDVFEALLSHLRLATNGGRIRSAMTLFRPWCGDGLQVRVWNHQLIRYAGYPLPSGKTLGDPMNIELTHIAMLLGWKPPVEPSAFDLLPLIIEAGGSLRWFDIPRNEVLEVPIRQGVWFEPSNPFSRLGLN